MDNIAGPNPPSPGRSTSRSRRWCSCGSSRRWACWCRPSAPPEFTLDNYRNVLFDPGNREGMAKAFFNTLTVTIPATIIPILIAAFAAYALAWMDFPGRALLIAAVVGAAGGAAATGADPALKLHNASASERAIWASGWRIPASACRSRSICCATTWSACRATSSRTPRRRRDGFPDLHQDHPAAVSFPALASFAIFQFLWTWNDLLVAKVFLIDATGETTVMTARSSNFWARAAATGKSWPRRPSSRSRCRWWCSSPCSATSCAACWPAR
jgi:alpha-glucoside transport system permease protein